MGTLDTTIMVAFHDALRRDVEQVARRAADPNGRLDSALGWELFSRYLEIHHRAEDDLLWPMLLQVLEGRDDDLALVQALEDEHAQIDPLVEQANAVLRGESDESLADVVDALATGLGDHLRHEEQDGLPMMGRVLSEEQWTQFGQGAGGRVADDAARWVPWMLDGARNAQDVLDRMPPPFRQGYTDGWRESYAELVVWP
jgi:iron-sulfur cluster repair protein YtfE (RIC family)